MKSINKYVLFGLILLAGILIGWLIKPSVAVEEVDEHQHELVEEGQVWTCSMHPQIRQSEPGKCPLCGMDLIPLESAADEGEALAVRMSPTAMRLANVQTAVVGYGLPTREVRVNGKIQPDERRVYSQVSHLEGRVEQLLINFTGEPVRRGQQLATLYSPELVTAQQELFAAQKVKDLQPALFNAAKEKLKNWKLTDAQIEAILADGQHHERFPILADVGGIVLEKRVNLGDYLMRGMPLYDIADLSRVWVLFDVYESDLPWVKVGSTVEFTVPSLPGRTFSGKVSFIDPVIDPATRVAKARVEIANPGGRLKPEMFAVGLVKTPVSARQEQLIVPKSAVLWTGERSVVYSKHETDQGISFQLREVVLGPLVGDGYVIREGLAPGEEIAVNGTFSIDAAAQLAGKPSMMQPAGGAVATGHQHGEAAAPVPSVAASQAAKSAVDKLFDHYFPLKDALIQADLMTAKKQAANLRRAIANTSMDLFTGPAHDPWMRHSGAAVKALEPLAAAADIGKARSHFKPLSTQMVALAKAFGPFDETVYVQHCPMADNNTGADWLSLDKPIRNPYFGDQMLTCGSVTETIK